MASIRKRFGKWQVNIRKKGHPAIYKRFHDIKDARKFARTVESQMERNVFEDYSGARGTTLREILVRYRDERTAVKKGVLCVCGDGIIYLLFNISYKPPGWLNNSSRPLDASPIFLAFSLEAASSAAVLFLV